MNNNVIGDGQIRIDADVTQAVAGLNKVSSSLATLVPGGSTIESLLQRINIGFGQIATGVVRLSALKVTDLVRDFVSAGTDMAKTLESASAAFEVMLGSEEAAMELVEDIQANAVTTPFDVDNLVTTTQKLALITKNGAQAEQTTLDLGKALTAAGRGNAELTRMATNLQQIGTNAYVTARDVREFGNAGIDIVHIVAEYSDAFKETGKDASEVMEWLQDISNPYEVIVNALHAATNGTGEFADIYEKSMTTMKQVTENFSDAVGILSYRVLESSNSFSVAKGFMQQFTQLFTDTTFAANAAEALSHLVDEFNELVKVEPIIEGIRSVVSAFASGQFDNAIVFFKAFFNAISKFSGIQFITNILKVFFDLFSNNHSAEEVAKVATQLGNLVRVILELVFISKVGTYFGNLAAQIIMFGSSVVTIATKLGGMIVSLAGVSQAVIKTKTALQTLKLVSLSTVGAITAVVVAIAAMAASSPEEFFENIVSGFKNVVEVLKKVVGQFTSIGFNLIAGLWNGMADALNTVFAKIGEAATGIVNAFRSALGIHSPSTRMRDDVGQYIDLGIAAGISKYAKKIYSASTKVANKLVELQSDYVKEMSDLGALDLVQQVSVYKYLTSLYKQGTEARLEMDEKLHDAETAIAQEIIDLVDEYNEEFEDAYDTAKKYYDMFEYTQSTLTRTTASVIEGLSRQNQNMEKYYENIAKISKMGFNEDFLEYLYEEGMDASSEVAGLSQATAEQIDEINKLWETRGDVATKIAVTNTKELKDETLEQIDYLQSGLETKTVDVYDTGTLLVSQFTRGIYDAIPTLEDAIAAVNATASETDDALEEVETTNFDAVTDGIAELKTDLSELELEAFDTTDAFSLIKNILSEMPWYVWAGAGVFALTQIVQSVEQASSRWNKFIKTTNAYKEAAQKSNSLWLNRLRKDQDAYYEGVDQDVISAYRTQSYAINASYEQQSRMIKQSHQLWRTGVSETFTDVRTTISGTVKTIAGSILDSIRALLDEALIFIRYSLKSIVETVVDIAGDVLNEINRLFSKLISFVEKGIIDLSTSMARSLPYVQNILNVIQGYINTFIKNIFSGLNELVKGAGKLIKTAGKAIGDGIAAILKPLGSTEIIMGAAALVLVATALLEVAIAAQTFSSVSVESALNLTAFAVALYGLTMAVSLLGNIAAGAVAGAIAMAAVGAGLAVAAAALSLASDAVDKLNYVNLLLLTAALTVAAGCASLIAQLAPFVIIGSIANAAIGAGLAVAALCLGVASEAVDKINYQNLLLLTLELAAAGIAMAIVGTWGWLAGIGAIATAAVGAGLAVAAICLATASEAVSKINYGNLLLFVGVVALASVIMGAISAFAVFGTIGAICSMIISGGLLVSAIALAEASVQAGRIDLEKLKMLEEIVAVTATVMGVIAGFAVFGAIGSICSMIISGGLLVTAIALAETSKHVGEINGGQLNNLVAYIATVSSVLSAIALFSAFGAISAIADTVMAGALVLIVNSLVTATTKASEIQPDNFDLIYLSIAKLQGIDWGGVLGSLGKSWSSNNIAEVASNVAEIVETLVQISANLVVLRDIAPDIQSDLDLMKQIVDALADLDFGAVGKSKKNKNSSANLDEVTSSVANIIDKLKGVLNNLNELDKLVAGKETTVQDQVNNAIELVLIIAKFEGENGETLDTKSSVFSKAYDGLKEAVANIGGVTENVTSIIGGIKGLVENLQEVNKVASSAEKVKQYVQQAVELVRIIAEFKDKDGNTITTKGEWFSAAYEDLKTAVANIKEVASSVSDILSNIKNVVDILVEFEKNDINADKVQTYVDNANQIVAKVSSISITAENLDKTAEAAKNVNTIAENVGSILGHVKTILDNMANFVGDNAKNFDLITDESDNGYISKINKMIAALGRLSASNDTENAYKNLADNLSSLSSAVGNVNSILTAVQTMVDNVNNYHDKIKGLDMEEIIGEINNLLITIVGGTESDGITPHTGIQVPSNNFSQDTVDKLGYISSTLDKIKEIADKAKSVPDVGNSLAGIDAIVNFIKDTMSQIPDAIDGYKNGLETEGQNYADAFRDGWYNAVNNMGDLGEKLQGVLWASLEGKMQDEYYQGETMAEKIIEGIRGHAGAMGDAASYLQGEFWGKLESKMTDEWNQGKNMSSQVIQGIYSNTNDWWTAGDNVAIGFAGGIERNIWRINKAAGEMSQAAINKLKDVLDIHSPSKVMAEMGGYVTQGFADGIEDGLKDVEEAGEKLANAVMDGYDSAIEPIDLTAYSARTAADQAALGLGGTSTRTTTVNQYNNIYDNMDMSKALNELTWSVSRA